MLGVWRVGVYARIVDTTDQPSREASEIVEANRRVHSLLASSYNETEPHFRPENRAKVLRRLTELAGIAPSRVRMLDLGCGTGFLLSLAHPLFESIDGIDATPAMLARVDLSPGNIHLHEGVVERLPFESEAFDMVTAYSFLDHLEDHVVVLAEAHRVLKPGGVLYFDLVPNQRFWHAIESAARSDDRGIDPIVDREIHELLHHEEKLQAAFGVAPEDWRNAEPAKSAGKGFDPDVLADEVSAVGFTTTIRHEWYLGQAAVMHGDSASSADLIDGHLRRLLPVTSSLFKYLVVTAVKK